MGLRSEPMSQENVEVVERECRGPRTEGDVEERDERLRILPPALDPVPSRVLIPDLAGVQQGP